MAKKSSTIMRTVDGDILVALCTQCKCCLADSNHCYIDHTTKSIAELCGCGECLNKAKAFQVWYEIRVESDRVRTELARQRKAA